MAKIDNELHSSIRHVLYQIPGARLGILFGSLAAGRVGPSSDLDLAILADHPLSPMDKTALIEHLAVTIRRPVDLVDLHTVGEPLLGQILSQGKLVFGGDTDYGRLIARHLLDEADFLPYRNRILEERRNAWIGKS